LCVEPTSGKSVRALRPLDEIDLLAQKASRPGKVGAVIPSSVHHATDTTITRRHDVLHR